MPTHKPYIRENALWNWQKWTHHAAESYHCRKWKRPICRSENWYSPCGTWGIKRYLLYDNTRTVFNISVYQEDKSPVCFVCWTLREVLMSELGWVAWSLPPARDVTSQDWHSDCGDHDDDDIDNNDNDGNNDTDYDGESGDVSSTRQQNSDNDGMLTRSGRVPRRGPRAAGTIGGQRDASNGRLGRLVRNV